MFIAKVKEGQSIRIGDQKIKAVSVPAPGYVWIEVEGEPSHFLVAWDRKLEIYPNVFVTVDRTVCYSKQIKFFFKAPRTVSIREIRDDNHGIRERDPAS